MELFIWNLPYGSIFDNYVNFGSFANLFLQIPFEINMHILSFLGGVRHNTDVFYTILIIALVYGGYTANSIARALYVRISLSSPQSFKLSGISNRNGSFIGICSPLKTETESPRKPHRMSNAKSFFIAKTTKRQWGHFEQAMTTKFVGGWVTCLGLGFVERTHDGKC